MNAPKYIKEELKLINPMYFAFFNPHIRDRKSMSYGRGRWQIRKWTGYYPKRLDLALCYGYSEIIFTICQEEMTEDGLIDAGYKSLDMRAVTAIRKSFWWKSQWKKRLAEIDWNNEQIERKADAELEWQSRHVAKDIYRKLHEPSVMLSGKKWKV